MRRSFFLAFGIQRDRVFPRAPGAVGIFHAEEFNHVAGYIHATGGVDARGDAEGNFSRVGRTLGGDSAAISSSALSPGFTARRRASRPRLAKTRFSPSADGVGDGRDGYNFHE